MTKSDRRPGILFGPDGKIRLLWRAVIFYVLADWLLPLVVDPALGFVLGVLHAADGLTAANGAVGERELRPRADLHCHFCMVRRPPRGQLWLPHVPGDCVGLVLYLVALPSAP
jgi:hypothetical protein